MKLSKKSFSILIAIFALFFFSCDAAFDASVSGSVVDKELNDEDPTSGSIENVIVYLYLDESDRDMDHLFWTYKNWKPDEKEVDYKLTAEEKKLGLSNYKLGALYEEQTVTNSQGNFTLEGIWWLDYFPTFGTQASTTEGYFMFYHKDYGMVKYENVVKLTGDGRTRQLPPMKIIKSIHEAILSGRILDKNLKENGQSKGLSGVTVTVYTTDVWTVDGANPDNYESGTVVVKSSDWKTNPSYTFTTDSEGYFSQDVSFRKFPEGSSVEVFKTQMLVTYSLSNYSLFELTDEANVKYTANNWTGTYGDVDLKLPKNWVLFDTTNMKKDFDLDNDTFTDIYYPIDVSVSKIEEGRIPTDRDKNKVIMDDVYMRGNRLSASIEGRVFNADPNSLAPGTDKNTIAVDGVTISVKDFKTDTKSLATDTTSTKIISASDPPITEKGSYSINLSITSYNHQEDTFERPLYIEASLPSEYNPADNSGINGGKVKFSIDGVSENIKYDFILTK